jgi:hypothetical protein
MKTMTLMLGLLVSSTVFAAPPEARAAAQQARIQQGVASGQLTGPEARRLERREARLQREIVRDRIDGGGLSAAERARIERRQDRLSRGIAHQKHDLQTR